MQYGIFITKSYLQWRLRNLTSTARKVEEILWYYIDFNSATASPAQGTMAGLSGLSRSSIARGITELECKRIINKVHKKSRGKKQYFYNQYLLLNYKKKKIIIPNMELTESEIDSILDNFLKKRGNNG